MLWVAIELTTFIEVMLISAFPSRGTVADCGATKIHSTSICKAL
jgi:hypothetical protein